MWGDFNIQCRRGKHVRLLTVVEDTLSCTCLLYTALLVPDNFSQLVHCSDFSFSAHTRKLEERVALTTQRGMAHRK